ncbi:MAG: heavy-metal-associated domain-containing protein [Clostridiales bacterium]|jgi:copper chaperone CopZ|nr:heavy-metal-associated domain-containing protein [Clostridiales bacterium]
MYKVTVKIDGMACGMCEAHMNDAIRKICPDAKKVSSSHKKGETTFLSEAEVDEEKIREAVTETGYTFEGLTQEPHKKGLFH